MSVTTTLLPLLLVVLLMGGCLCEEGAGAGEKEADDSKATESQQVKTKAEAESSGGEKGKRAPAALTAVPSANSVTTAPAHAKVMIMPPVSLMIAMPHPSGRFLMLFPTTQLMPVMPIPYAHMSGQHSHPQQQPAATPNHHQDHPAMFAARHQMLYNGPNYQQHRDNHYFPQHSSYHPQSYQGGYKRMSSEIN